MSIELSILPHQNDFLKAIRKAFEDIRVVGGEDIYQNPLIDLEDSRLKENINHLWKGYEDLQAIPKDWRTRDDDNYLGIDIRMETGTGKMFFASIISQLLQIFFPSKGWGILSPTKRSNFSVIRFSY